MGGQLVENKIHQNIENFNFEILNILKLHPKVKLTKCHKTHLYNEKKNLGH